MLRSSGINFLPLRWRTCASVCSQRLSRWRPAKSLSMQLSCLIMLRMLVCDGDSYLRAFSACRAEVMITSFRVGSLRARSVEGESDCMLAHAGSSLAGASHSKCRFPKDGRCQTETGPCTDFPGACFASVPMLRPHGCLVHVLSPCVPAILHGGWLLRCVPARCFCCTSSMSAQLRVLVLQHAASWKPMLSWLMLTLECLPSACSPFLG